MILCPVCGNFSDSHTCEVCGIKLSIGHPSEFKGDDKSNKKNESENH